VINARRLSSGSGEERTSARLHFSHDRSCRIFCILRYTKGHPGLLYILIEKGKAVWGRVLHSTGERVWPQRGLHRRFLHLQAYEARRGKAVRVRRGHWKDEFAGMRGIIQERWGNSEHAAVEVLLEDGSSELFWLADLSEVDRRVSV
jgi:hypothetical protein